MRASERERRTMGRSGLLLPIGEGPMASLVDAADLEPEELRAWVGRAPRLFLEEIVFASLTEASRKRPRL